MFTRQSYNESNRRTLYSWRLIATGYVLFLNRNNLVLMPGLSTSVHTHFVNRSLSSLEIPQCQPPNITVEEVTSKSAQIAWEAIIIRETKKPHGNYSVMLRDQIGNAILLTTTSRLSIDLVKNLRPNHKYSFSVAGVGLECFKDLTPHTFKTLEDG